MKNSIHKKSIVIAVIIGTFLGCNNGDGIVIVNRPDTAKANDYYIGNRDPLAPGSLIKLPIGSIEPQGWLCKQLELEANVFFWTSSRIKPVHDKRRQSLAQSGRNRRKIL